MAKQTSFTYQKKVLENFSSLLQDFATDLESISEKYGRNIYSLYEEHGLMEEIYVDYQKSYVESIKDTLAQLSLKIQEEHIPFVEREIDFISSR